MELHSTIPEPTTAPLIPPDAIPAIVGLVVDEIPLRVLLELAARCEEEEQ